MNASEMLYKAAGVAVSTGSGSGSGSGFLVKGYMTVFNIPDLVNDITVPGAFSETIQRNPHPPLLWGHDVKLPPIGRVKHWAEVSDGVFFIAEVLDTSLGEDVKKGVKAGAITGVSYGYNVRKSSPEFRKGTRYNRLENVDVLELSLVNFPAHPDARLTGTEGKDLFTIGEVECLKTCGVKLLPSQLYDYVNALERQAERKVQPVTVTVKEIDRELKELREM